MQIGALRSTVLVTTIALAAASCENMTPGQNAAVFGGAAALTAGTIARAAGMSSAESFATGAAVGAVVAATAYVIAKHQASERQRRVAEERARIAYARLKARQEAHQREVAKNNQSAGSRSTAGTPAKLPRYIAVDTEKDEHTAPQAKKSVMIWDTESHQVVGNNVYDVSNPPAVGSTAKFETYSAQYVGSGS
ncbi:MAG TPA: hypothetical protein VGH90_05965 [Chthoniobacteraceae bacterium]|jgi:hypothetical protein